MREQFDAKPLEIVTRGEAIRIGAHDGCPYCEAAIAFIKAHPGDYKVLVRPVDWGSDIVGLWFE